MALKDLKSNLDLVGGNLPVNNMENQLGPGFQNPTDIADQFHKDSLQEVPGGTSNSPFQDLNGVPDSSFNTLNGTSDSPFVPRNGTGDHMVDLLTNTVTSTNSGESYSPSTKDLNTSFDSRGDASNFQLPTVEADQKHKDSLTQESSYQHGNSTTSVGPSTLDINGVNGPPFNTEGYNSTTGQQLGGVDLHEALLTNSYSYSHGTPSPNYQSNVNISAGGFDLNGNLPTNGSYLNNLPQ